MALPAGTRLGPYEIRSAIGAGGMGEVYRAHDTTLGRDVAIKVLSASVSRDPARLARFEREARVLASLSHANIAAIYGVEQSTETRALVLELVDGPTLEDRILELMVEADDLTSVVKRTEAELGAEQKAVEGERKTIASQMTSLRSSLETLATDRAAVVRDLTPAALAVFELVSRRRHGVAVAAARDGICTLCHVRLRPQVFNTVLRNDQIIQCDSCQRILYYVPVAAPTPTDNVSQPAQ